MITPADISSAVAAGVRAVNERREGEVRRMLSLWVSEMEPCTICDAASHEILGLGLAGGDGKIIVRNEVAT